VLACPCLRASLNQAIVHTAPYTTIHQRMPTIIYHSATLWGLTLMPGCDVLGANVLQLVLQSNKCIGDDTKAAARQTKLHKKKHKKNKYGENDFQYGEQNYYTLQCGRWLWDDMPWNSRKRPPYWNSTSMLNISPQSTCYSAPVCEILCYPNRTTLSRKK